MPITHSAAYCPLQDDEFRTELGFLASTFPNCHRTPLWGGGRNLNEMETNARLYLVAHNHYALSKFAVGTTTWTAAELAALLRNDRLPLGHRNIELLVCNAARSTVSVALAARFRQLSTEYHAAVAADDTRTADRRSATYDRLSEQLADAADYSDRRQMLPIACQLRAEMASLGYSDLTITCYKAPIAFVFSQREVLLDLRDHGLRWGVAARTRPDLKVLWH